MQSAHSNAAVKAIVITGANSTFCAGFDINQFVSGGGGLDGDVNDMLCNLVEAGPKPTVAAIKGVALGGGLEVAMACNARVCGDKTSLGLPELKLGIIPGFGGTQRLPRLVGLKKAVELILSSKNVKGDQAKKLGLVDAVTTDASSPQSLPSPPPSHIPCTSSTSIGRFLALNIASPLLFVGDCLDGGEADGFGPCHRKPTEE